MPPPDLSRPANPGGLRRLLGVNLGCVALIFALLEIWRPCYFLTDDNLDWAFPLLTGMGERMLHGQSPFVSDYLYGGSYDLLRDCTCFLWHPIYLLAALVANTPARFCSLEIVAFFFLLLGAAGFVCLADFLRRDRELQLSDARLTLYTLSFTFSMIVLCIGPSWLNFLGNHSAMPWLALGILQRSWRRGLGLVGLFSIHHLLAGHSESAISTTLFLTVFAAGVAGIRRSWVPLLSWFGGYAVALVVLSPLLVPAVGGFLASNRSGGFEAGTMSQFAVPAPLLPLSYFFSTSSRWWRIPYTFGACAPVYSAAFLSCAAAWALIPALISRARWRGLEIVTLAVAAFALLLITRPLFVSEILVHLPLLRAMRWPFREIVQFQFFLHLFLVLRPAGGSVYVRRGLVTAGVLFFLLPLPFLPAPSFNPMLLDRDLLFSGVAANYWTQVKTLLAPGDVIVPVADASLVHAHIFGVPFTLLGATNYPILFHVRSGTGYSLTVPRDQLYLREPPAMSTGIYDPGQESALLQERPNVRFVTLQSMDPPVITLSSRTGPPIDLTALPQH